MEVFSFFKYWRGTGNGGGGTTGSMRANIRTTIATTLREIMLETDEDDEDEGPFFDLEFTVPDDEQDNTNTDSEDDDPDFNFRVSSSSSCCEPIEPSSTGFNPSEPKFPVSIFKSATRFRVLGLKKPKSTANVEINDTKQPHQSQTRSQLQHSKFFAVKFKVEEVPIVSLFTRENSSRSSVDKTNSQSSEEVVSQEKKFAKDVIRKYLKMIKPLYVRVSKRYGEKLRFSGQLRLKVGKAGPAASISSIPISTPTTKEVKLEQSERSAGNVKSQKQGNLPAGLRVVCKHLGKSRSTSSAGTAIPTVQIQAKKRDDSLLQQQDGIQSAILHCKRSFSASRDSDFTLLTRSMSDPSHEKLFHSSRNLSGEANLFCN